MREHQHKPSNTPSAALRMVPVVFPRRFPSGYVNNVEGWGIPEVELHSKLPDGTYKLLTLDVDLGSECSLHCPHCFRKSKVLDTSAPALDLAFMVKLLEDGKRLGLRTVKILGAGEPFENPELLDFLDAATALDVHVAVFTKGHVLGSDELAARYFGGRGIKDARHLRQALKSLKVSILLGFNSFGRDLQNAFVGVSDVDPLADYVNIRDRALIGLIEDGFSKYVEGQATRLALIAAPVKPENVLEVFEIYKWGRRRNLYVLSCPTTLSGLGGAEYRREKRTKHFSQYINALEDLYVKTYVWNMRNNITSLPSFAKEGVSLYPGVHPCNQVAAGMYVTLRGKVLRCPGRDTPDFVVAGDIRHESLLEVWRRSANYGLAAQEDRFNFGCIAREGYFFPDAQEFYQRIYNKVIETCDERP